VFKTVFGMGLHQGACEEGVRKNNFFGTYLVGPLLVMNPLFTKKLLKIMGAGDVSLAFEDEVMQAYKLRVEDFKQAKRK